MRQILFSCVVAVIGASSTQAPSREISPRLDPARRGMIADRSQTVALGERSRAEKGGEFADSLSGGPDFYEVRDAGNEGLSLRARASPRARLLVHFPNGTELKNLGCKKVSYGRRWCKVERPDVPSARGWVNGRYLHEQAGAK